MLGTQDDSVDVGDEALPYAHIVVFPEPHDATEQLVSSPAHEWLNVSPSLAVQVVIGCGVCA